MKYIELPQKINILVNLILESKILIVVLMAMLLLTFLFVNRSISKNKYFILSGLSLIITLVVTIILNKNDLFKTFDDVMNNVFMNIYFPSVEFYIFILIIMLFMTINGFIKKKTNKAYKVNNILMFFITFFLFICFLVAIAKRNIDIFDRASVYTDQACIVLLQLSTSIFVIWLIVSLIIYIVNAILVRISVKQEVNNTVSNEIVEPKLVDVEMTNVVMENDEENINIIPNVVDNKVAYVNYQDDEDDFVIENPVIDRSTQFSLDQYRMFNRMLKTSVLLNSYKDNITMEDMLNPNTLGSHTEEEYNIYKKMLINYLS